MIDALVSSDEHKAHKTFQNFVGVVGDIPAALFGSVECPPEGEADLNYHRWGPDRHLLVNHDNPSTCDVLQIVFCGACAIERRRFEADSLRVPWTQVGQRAVGHQHWELVEKVERENLLPTLPILVVVGWAGNDVHGDYGYQGCTWIHSSI